MLRNEYKDVVGTLVDILSKEGGKFLTSSTVSKVSGVSGHRVSVTVEHKMSEGSSTTTIAGSHILVAVGRSPNTANIGLVEVGIELTPAGHVKVDESTADYRRRCLCRGRLCWRSLFHQPRFR
jgi:pyruvate/2-oxoglutarate dehydrogenase complex dihydrolipoamide dehydrogenase (E3) component